ADGNKLVAGLGTILTSTNSGATWTSTSVPSFGAFWIAVASSADGTALAAANADGSGFVYTSKDSGATWRTNMAPPGDWISLVFSAAGPRLAAAKGCCCNPGGPSCGGPVYTSTDSGATWTSNNVPDAFAVASSADGGKLVAVVNGGGIWTYQS